MQGFLQRFPDLRFIPEAAGSMEVSRCVGFPVGLTEWNEMHKGQV